MGLRQIYLWTLQRDLRYPSRQQRANRLLSQGSAERCRAPATSFLIPHPIRTVCAEKHIYMHLFTHTDMYTKSGT